jgi:hypothetical protein
VDKNGNKKWRRNYGGSGYDGCFAVTQIPNGDYILAGSGNGVFDLIGSYRVYKINTAGAKQWRRDYGGPGNECSTLIATYQKEGEGT